MNAFLYGLALQWKLDLRSKTLLITCYLVPLLFFVMMGGIFTTILPGAEETLLPAMTVFGGTMGALIGLPPSLVEIYGSDIKKVYQANGVPLSLGLVLTNLSAFLHLFLMSILLYLLAPVLFDAALRTPWTIFRGTGVLPGGVSEHCQHCGIGCERPCENLYGFHSSLSPLHPPLWHPVSRRVAAGGSGNGREALPRYLGIFPVDRTGVHRGARGSASAPPGAWGRCLRSSPAQNQDAAVRGKIS